MMTTRSCLVPLLTLSLALGGLATGVGARTRVVVTTDGEIDDRCSMIRFLLYANEWDIRGLVHSSSKYHWLGDAEHARHNWEDVSWLDRQLDAYAAVYPNLSRHDSAYPTPEDLRRQVFVGNIAYEGDLAAPTPGSQRIVEVLLDPDPSPVWLQAWGGANTIARALKTIHDDHPDRVAEVSRKARLFLISQQDSTLQDYILKAWPDATIILSTAFGAVGYQWQRIMSPEDQAYFDGAWMKANILEGHGPLCSLYEAHPDGRFRSEGDSPSFMHLINVGLDAEADPSWGGWGGRFVRREPLWVSSPEKHDAILRWAAAFQNDWAARASWCVKAPAEANHRPLAKLNGDQTEAAVVVTPEPGQEVQLTARGSTDPDGGRLSYRWSTYVDAGTYWAELPIAGADGPEATVAVPADAAGRTAHVILEVTDHGVPPLTSYRRAVLRVAGEPQPSPEERYLATPITQLAGPPAATGPWQFYRAVNLNGPATNVDGQIWEGGDAPNVVGPESRLNRDQVTLKPATDEARAAMIHSFRWGRPATVRLSAVPAGTYAVFVYAWEDNNSETLTFELNGRVVLRNHASGQAGEWHRLGPWTVDVSDGTVDVTASGGAANLSGIEVWRRTAD